MPPMRPPHPLRGFSRSSRNGALGHYKAASGCANANAARPNLPPPGGPSGCPSGATAIHHLAQELDLAGRINRTISPDRDVQVRDALTVGEALVAALIARACAPRRQRAFAHW